MKILFLEGAPHWTGGSKRVLLLARQLKKLGHNIIIGCRQTALLGNFAAREGFVVKRINPLGGIDLLCFVKIFKILREYKPDIVDIFSPVFCRTGSLAARILNIRVVFTRNVAFRKGPVKRLINRLVYAMAHKIIAVSDRIKEDLIKDFRLNKDKIAVVKGGIDLEEIRAVTEEETNKVKQEFGLNGQKVVGVITQRNTAGYIKDRKCKDYYCGCG
jgi:glycosyltransferase involved in cell wall biosynthesis